ncbi:MAG: RNA-binding protein [Leeuwenhoekiella sp.]|nr:MAG: RNA-binding protein [Leeuwenhoekiella sp.]
MAQRDADPKSIKDVLGAFVEKNKLQKGIDKVDVAEAWRDVMGPAIAKYTTQIKLDGDRLMIQLSSSVLREELSYGKEKIRTNLNEQLGREIIKKVILR